MQIFVIVNHMFGSFRRLFMLQEDRFLKILEFLKEKPIATFAELSEYTNVSLGTIRRDLARLEQNGMLNVVRGGAAARKDDLTKQAFDMRGIEHRNEKKELVELLKNVVIDGQAIALNSGTTNIEVARFLVKNYKRLTIITNNLRIVEALQGAENFTVILSGGIFNSEEYSFWGKECEEEILSYNFDLCILAVNAISEKKGITDFRLKEIGIIKAFMESSLRKVVVADYSKFDRVAYLNICGIDEVDLIFSDSSLTQEQIDRYKNKGVQIFTPSMEAQN